MPNAMECRRQEGKAARSEGKVPIRPTVDSTLSEHIVCAELALLALEAMENARLIEFIEARRGTESEVRFVNNIAWGMREVARTFDTEVKRMQDTCDHGYHTSNWESPDVRRCVHCMHHK